MPWRTHVDLDLQRWDCREVSHAHQVVGCAGEGEDPVHFAHSAMPHFAQQGDRLQPAETLFDALSLLLTETIAGMLCRAPVDCAPTAPCQVLRHMGRHSQMSTLGHEIPSVEALISAHGHRLPSRNLLQHIPTGKTRFARRTIPLTNRACGALGRLWKSGKLFEGLATNQVIMRRHK